MGYYYIEWYARYAGFVVRDSRTQKLVWTEENGPLDFSSSPLVFSSRSAAADYLAAQEVTA